MPFPLEADAISAPPQEPVQKQFLLLRWLLVIVSSSMILASQNLLMDLLWGRLFVLLLILSNLLLHFVPEKTFTRPAFYSAVGIGDVFLVTLALIISGQTGTDLYLLYFLIIILSALNLGLTQIVINTALIILLYGFVLFWAPAGNGLSDSTLLLRLPFFFIVALFYGHLVQLIRKERLEKEKSLDSFRSYMSRENVQKLLAELNQDITSMDIDSLLKKLTEKAREVLRVDISDIGLMGQGAWELKAVSGVEPELLRADRMESPRGRRKWIMDNRSPLMIPDITRPTHHTTGESVSALDIRGYLGVPLVSRTREVIGVLRALSYRPKEFTREEVDLLQQLANGATIAIENARLYEELQKKSSELARAHRERENIMESVPDIIYVLDITGVVTQWNRKAETVTGLSPGELKGKPALEFFPDEDKPIIVRAMRETLEKGYAEAEGRLLNKDGSAIPYYWTGATLKDEVGNIIGLTGTGRNITAQKRAEEEIKKLLAEVQQKSRDLARVNEELLNAYETKSGFLNTLAHELRTPLNVMIGTQQLLIEGAFGELSEKPKEGLETIGRQAFTLVNLINEVLDLARLEARKAPLSIEEVLLEEIMNDLEASFIPLVKEKNVKLEFRLDDPGLKIKSDEGKIKQILQNLLSNAVKYTDKGEIEVRVRALLDEQARDDQGISIAIKDTGIGISEADLPHIFEAFYMAEGVDRRKYPSTGLGLSIVKRLVELLDGEIRVETELGKGTTFWVTLPSVQPTGP